MSRPSVLSFISLLTALSISMPAAAVADAVNNESNHFNFNEVVALSQEAILTAGLKPNAAAAKLRVFLKREFGYDVSCDSRWFEGLDDMTCLIGFRSFARALYRGLIPRLNKLESRGVKFVLVSHYRLDQGEDERVEGDEQFVSASVNYRWQPEEMADVVKRVLAGQNFRTRVAIEHAFSQAVEDLKANLNATLEFDKGLSMALRWSLVNTLTSIGKRDPRLLKRRADVLQVTYRFNRLHEEKLRLVEQVDVLGGPDELRAFLSDGPDESSIVAEEKRVREGQIRVENLKIQLQRDFRLQVECSPVNLRLEQCSSAMMRLSSVLTSAWQGRHLTVGHVLIISASENWWAVDSFADAETGETVLMIRDDFKPPSFIGFIEDKRWLR